MKGLPSGYNKDLQEDKEAVFDAEATVSGSLDAVAVVVEGLGVNTDRAERAAAGAAAGDRRRGLPCRARACRSVAAHELVGAMTGACSPRAGTSNRCRWRNGAGTRSCSTPTSIDRGHHPRVGRSAADPQSTHRGGRQAALKDLGDWLRGRKQETGNWKWKVGSRQRSVLPPTEGLAETASAALTRPFLKENEVLLGA